MDSTVKGIWSDKDIYLSRNPSILWRKNQDGTILALDEVSGAAWALSKGLSDIWIKIGTGIIVTNLPSLDKENDAISQVLDKGIESLIFHKLVTVSDKDIKECHSAKPSTLAYSVLGQVEGPFACDIIEFGACQRCNWLVAFYQYYVGCNGDENEQQSQSILPRN